MTGTAGTSQLRHRQETTWSSPAFAGWLMTRKWCWGKGEVVVTSFAQSLAQNTNKLCFSPHFILCLSQHICRRTIRPAWSNSIDKKSWIWGEKPTSKFTPHTLLLIQSCRRLRPLTNKPDVFYRWKEWQPGFPMSIDANRHKDLPRDIQFDSEKGVDFVLNYTKAYVLHFNWEGCFSKASTGLHSSADSWRSSGQGTANQRSQALDVSSLCHDQM